IERGKNDALARQRRSRTQLLEHIEQLPRARIVSGTQSKIVTAFNKILRQALKPVRALYHGGAGVVARSAPARRKAGEFEMVALVQAFDFLDDAVEPLDLAIRWLRGNVEVHAQRQFPGARQLLQHSTMGECYPARMHIADRGDTEAVQLA